MPILPIDKCEDCGQAIDEKEALFEYTDADTDPREITKFIVCTECHNLDHFAGEFEQIRWALPEDGSDVQH